MGCLRCVCGVARVQALSLMQVQMQTQMFTRHKHGGFKYAEEAKERTRRKEAASDPFTSAQPLTRLIRLPTLNGDFSVTQHTHTKLRVRDRRYLGWAAHRFDENGNRKWSKETIARRNRYVRAVRLLFCSSLRPPARPPARACHSLL